MRSRLDIILETVNNILDENVEGDVADMKKKGHRKLAQIYRRAVDSITYPAPDVMKIGGRFARENERYGKVADRLARRVKTRKAKG